MADYVASQASRWLLNGPLRRKLRVVVSGHTHRYLDLTAAGVRHLWMPSSGFIISDPMQNSIGENVVGVGLLTLDDDAASFELWCPDGMRRHERSSLRVFQMAGGAVTADAN